MLTRSRRAPSRLTTLLGVTLLALTGVTGCAAEPQLPPHTAEQPPPPSPEELREQAAADWAATASTRELVGSVIMATAPTTDAAELRTLMEDTGLGGFIIMGANVPASPDELRAITTQLTVDPALPPLIGIDEEGGLVTRLPWDTLPGADTLRDQPAERSGAAFSERAAMLADVGVNVNFGIVADVTPDAWSFIYPRTLGDTGAEASPRVAAAVAGERGTVASTLKHFPGHGATADDSHTGIPSATTPLAAWRADTALPFKAGIDAGAELLMFGHLAYAEVSPTPASLAPEWYAIAREELGFDGVTVTDDLGMLRASGIAEYQDPVATTIAAITAGADLALTVIGMDAAGVRGLVDGVTTAVDDGTLSESRLRDAATRVTLLRLELSEEPAEGSPQGAKDSLGPE